MQINKSASLFSRTSITIGITLFIFQVFIFISFIVFLLLPVVKTSATTMAATILTSTQNWVELTPEQQNEFSKTLKQLYNFELQIGHSDINLHDHPYEPYIFFLEQALSRQFEGFSQFYIDSIDPELYRAKLSYNNHPFELTIPLHQLGGSPLVVFYTILFIGLLLTFLSSLFLAYHLNKPINRLIGAIKQLSHGVSPAPLVETGCKELGVLARSVNILSGKVDELLENRTVMLAGISHDLRTPLTRMALSIEMLSDSKNPQLSQRIEQDIVLMNKMIGYYMELACCLTKEKTQETELYPLLQTSVKAVQDCSDIVIKLNVKPSLRCETAWTYPVALKRIVDNLLENAVRYGQSRPVTVSYDIINEHETKQLVIEIRDQGMGIPEVEIKKVFRPFYRLEPSRNPGFGGSGLGLAIVSHLAQAHNWEVKLINATEGGLIAQINIPL